ncbi:MAG: hypothetical protein PHC80_08415 [Eubacteriales bacterium]|nr:hypothetical protein [Eubacteriales bacterium]
MEACRKMDEAQETFVIRVNRKAGGAWQGNVVWIGERCEQQFRNMQELITLMDDTLQQAGDE